MLKFTLAEPHRRCPYAHLENLTAIGLSALLLVACTTIQKEADVTQMQNHVAHLVRPLPKDADLTRIDEQNRWIGKGCYITKSGKFEPLPNDSKSPGKTSASAKKAMGRPTISDEKAVAKDLKPVELTLPD